MAEASGVKRMCPGSEKQGAANCDKCGYIKTDILNNM
jgi:hypothetical protein